MSKDGDDKCPPKAAPKKKVRIENSDQLSNQRTGDSVEIARDQTPITKMQGVTETPEPPKREEK